jgi:MFS family permease
VRWRLLAAIWLAAFLVSLDYTAVNVVLPTLARELDVGTSSIVWIALAYMLVVVALTLPAGAVVDRVGYLRALGWSLVLFAVASLLSALSSTLWTLVAMRALQGIGASVMFAIGPAVIKTMFPAATHGRAFTLFSTGPTVGLCAGPPIGGQLAGLFGWQSIFLFSLLAALLAIGLVTSAARDAGRGKARGPAPAGRLPSPLSVGLASAGLLMLLLALNQGQQWGWRSPAVAALLAAALAALTVLVLKERRAAVPIVERALFAAPDYLRAGVVLFLVLVAFGGSVFVMPFYLEWLRKLDLAAVGRLLMVQPAATIVLSIPVALWLGDVSRRALACAGVCLFALGFVLFALADRTAPVAMLVAALGLTGAGRALYYPTLIQTSMSEVPDRLAASASALQASARALAQLLGVVLFETLFSGLYPQALRPGLASRADGPGLVEMQGAFAAVFWVATVLAVLAFLTTFLLVEPARSSVAKDKA